MVILTDDDMADLPVTSSREIAVEKFVPSDQIDPMLLEKSYYLEPEKTGAKPYALLRQALLDADRMAVVTVALRQRTRSPCCACSDDVIVLQTMMWPDEIRTARLQRSRPARSRTPRSRWPTCSSRPWPATSTSPSSRTTTPVPSRRWSRPRSRAARSRRPPTSTKSSGEVVDLLAALQKSVEAAKTARGESDACGEAEEEARQEDGCEEGPPRRRPRRRRPAKKAAASDGQLTPSGADDREAVPSPTRAGASSTGGADST